MAKKETIQEFLNNFKDWPAIIQKKALQIYDQETEFALGQSVYVAPRRTGELQNKVQRIKAKATPDGIKSAYVFKAHSKTGFSYPIKMNEGGKFKIHKTINPNAQTHFAEYGVNKASPELMDRLSDLIEEVFIQS